MAVPFLHLKTDINVPVHDERFGLFLFCAIKKRADIMFLFMMNVLHVQAALKVGD